MKTFTRLILLFTFILSYQNIFASNLDEDDELIFYPTFLYLDSSKNEYKVKIHTHVFEKKEDSIKRKILIKYLSTEIGENPDSNSEIFKERTKWFLIDNKRGKEISIELFGKIFPLNETGPNGRSITEISIDKSLLSQENLESGFVDFKSITTKKNKNIYNGKFFLIKEDTTCLISDIDDTLKISDVRNKKALIKNSFMKPFQLVSGMNDFYNQIQSSGNSCFVNVSASPWQMYSVLNQFFTESGFPRTGYSMKDFRFKDSDFFNLFEKPEIYKFSTIEPMIQEWKKVKFILVGDSGEKDPEAYAKLASKYPNQVSRIYIRIAYDEDLTSRITNVFENIPKHKFQFFRTVSEIK
ncbi:phosphatidate phosphatase App1 family protein [Leptospira brenneri]|uniref:phosphatidate phosphatase App1 family protein n=1 Tax=Leptospira brenneri TaxID=2023182 RepID=UPI000C2AC188|nr:App1 family protein [Leptospira brenneri]PJZ44116.1 hypothetical protein CH361_17430 [Leptospira brenneri]